MAPAEVAKIVGYRAETVSRLATSPAGRFELERLRQESEKLLAEALPSLVEKSIAVLQQRFDSPIADVRYGAACFTLRHLAKPLIASLGVKGSDTDNTLITIIEMTNHSKDAN